MRKKILLTVILLSIIFLFAAKAYRNAKINYTRLSVSEHALVISEPLWNYDLDSTNDYLKVVAKNNNYSNIKVYDGSKSVLFEYTLPPADSLSSFLELTGLISILVFEEKIVKEDQVIGSLVVNWRDKSIYAIAWEFVVFILIVAIAILYIRLLDSKSVLEGKVNLIELQNTELKRQKEYIEEIFNFVPEGLITIDSNKKAIEFNKSFTTLVTQWSNISGVEVDEMQRFFLDSLQTHLKQADSGQYSMQIPGIILNLEFSSSSIPSVGNIDRVVSLRDVTEYTSMKRQLAQAQKLEAVGRLASGIAHEINTPTQYVLSNIDFIHEANEDINNILKVVEKLIIENDSRKENSIYLELQKILEDVDWPYLAEELPRAINQSKEGLRRITKIVMAMKHFSHPSGEVAEENDLNKAIESTVAVARNEWKYVAEVELLLAEDLPQVPCYLDEINQIFLAMIINSAQSIEEKFNHSDGIHGKIIITTKTRKNEVLITIEDNGKGMSETVVERIFDPFFTTKELNKGTGQGLAIVYDVIVNHHEGTIEVESTENIGTTFYITLPLS